MAGSGDNIQLLLAGQVDEFNRITGYTDCEVCILLFLRMLHSIDQFLCAEYIHIQVMCALTCSYGSFATEFREARRPLFSAP